MLLLAITLENAVNEVISKEDAEPEEEAAPGCKDDRKLVYISAILPKRLQDITEVNRMKTLHQVHN